MTRTRYRAYDDAYPHFLTCTVVGWLPVFTRPDAAEIVFNSWRFLADAGRLKIFGYVILENHLHLIASSTALSDQIAAFKSFTARQILDHLRSRGEEAILDQLRWFREKHKTDRWQQFWQEGSHPQQINGDEMMLQKLEYIHNNPVRRGYVSLPEHWRYSSASNYLGQNSVFPVMTEW
jgi:putative transposase